jgi:murein DD-endopeptidase MepM/ murein hydrolase activator NlpD
VKEGTYIALVGVDLKPDRYSQPVDFTLFPARDGEPYRISAELNIKHSVSSAKRVQKLSLPSGMVDLSQKRISQVRRDNRTLGDALAIQSRQRFWESSFILPLQGRITTRFGTGRILNGKQRSPHSGVDIAAEKGKGIKSANSGVIQLADKFFLSGKTVVVDHGWGVSTIYAHLDQIQVREGQRVEKGQPIGTVGETGRVTGPHLHFGAFIRGAKIDPLKLIEVTQDFGIQDPVASSR